MNRNLGLDVYYVPNSLPLGKGSTKRYSVPGPVGSGVFLQLGLRLPSVPASCYVQEIRLQNHLRGDTAAIARFWAGE